MLKYQVIQLNIIRFYLRLIKLFLSNLVCVKIILHKYFYNENLLDEKKRFTVDNMTMQKAKKSLPSCVFLQGEWLVYANDGM